MMFSLLIWDAQLDHVYTGCKGKAVSSETLEMSSNSRWHLSLHSVLHVCPAHSGPDCGLKRGGTYSVLYVAMNKLFPIILRIIKIVLFFLGFWE